MKIKEYLKELSIVILGILIAFWISNIGTDFKDRTTQRQVLHTILSELKDNNERIKSTDQNLEILQSTFKGIHNGDSSSTLNIDYIELNLKSIGYETAKNTVIFKDLNYALTSKIVENYESQNSLDELESKMLDELFLLIKNKRKNSQSSDIDFLLLQIRNLKNDLESFDLKQKQLIKDLQEFLKTE